MGPTYRPPKMTLTHLQIVGSTWHLLPSKLHVKYTERMSMMHPLNEAHMFPNPIQPYNGLIEVNLDANNDTINDLLGLHYAVNCMLFRMLNFSSFSVVGTNIVLFGYKWHPWITPALPNHSTTPIESSHWRLRLILSRISPHQITSTILHIFASIVFISQRICNSLPMDDKK